MTGGKFKKPQRGGGRTFSRRIEAVHTTQSNVVSFNGCHNNLSLDFSESGSENEALSEDMNNKSSILQIEINNPNHLVPTNRRRQRNTPLDMSTPIEMSRKERLQRKKQPNRKLHQEGKTEQAKTDLARLAVIRKQREEAAVLRHAEAKAKEATAKADLRASFGL
ncbi:hypothetical protein BGZ65_005568 [Modicella reniformis]|uniref:Casein kinase substrate phosphoprotein PP28 domain-containing protein n=1 Tax=Modicella reniformis TaxID=1440133 RepID=A0A9P6MGL6_9FUNG|nr:hypothetical protein BGZ65_005568 [Modicella reniformis]